MISAIEMKDKEAKDLMINLNDVFMLEYDEELSEQKIDDIITKGYSRIPIYSNDKSNIIGILMLKQLIGHRFDHIKSVRSSNIDLKRPIVIKPETNLLQLIRDFRIGKCHLAIITEKVQQVQSMLGLNKNNSLVGPRVSVQQFMNAKEESIVILGIITFEDVIESMLNMEIMDESDYDETYNPKCKRPKKTPTKHQDKETLSKFLFN